VIDTDYDMATKFQDGLALVQKEGLYKFINKKEKALGGFELIVHVYFLKNLPLSAKIRNGVT
jgi:hypothetical protein